MARRSLLSAALVGGLVIAAAVSAAPASATVATRAAAWTPSIASADSNVRKLVQCGNTMFAVGSFTSVEQGGKTHKRTNAFSFSATTGKLTAWNPYTNGIVNSVAVSPGCKSVWLGGQFTKVRHVAVSNLVEVGAVKGLVRKSFAHDVDGPLDTLLLVDHGEQLLAGGTYSSINGTARSYYASLDPQTGAVTAYLRAQVAGKLPPNAGSTKVYNQQLSPRGDRVLMEGDFTTIAGQPRLQLAEFDVGPHALRLDPWHNDTLNSTYCSQNVQFYGRAATFSPDESTIYLAATGFKGSSPFCDAVTAFTNEPDSTVKWINDTGGDSLYSVAASARNVYIGGHERWANNPTSHCAKGCVRRPGIGDISARTGRATSWNPTRDRGRGADDLLITPAGLWIASDTYFGSKLCAHTVHPGICFLPGTA
jgi:hypothetical protein